MKKNLNYLLVGGGIVLGAAVGLFMLVLSFDPAPTGTSRADDPPASSRSRPSEHGEAKSAELPPPPQSLPDPEEILRQMGTATSEAARSEAVAREEETMAEARRQAAADPAAALAWALLQGDLTRPALGIVMDAWARSDPAAAFEALRRLPASGLPDHRAYALTSLVGQWGAADPAAASMAVGTLPSSPETALLQSRILSQWSDEDPAGAAAGLVALVNGGQNGPDMEFLQASIATVATRLAAQNHETATKWAEGFPAGSPERTSAVAGVVQQWFEQDEPAVVAKWLEGMEPGAARDAGTVALVHAAAQIDPANAMAWAQTVSDTTIRARLTAFTVAGWLASDPKQAKLWIRDTDALSAGEKDLLLVTDRQIRGLSGAEPDGPNR